MEATSSIMPNGDALIGKCFAELVTYKCYSGPINTLEIGFLYNPNFPVGPDFLLPSDIVPKEKQPNNTIDAVMLTGRYDAKHRNILEKTQEKYRLHSENSPQNKSTILDFRNQNSSDSAQAGLLLIGNINDILQILPVDQIMLDRQTILSDVNAIKRAGYWAE